MILKRLALLSFLFVFALPSFAQQAATTSAPQAARDPQAVALVQQSLAAMGGTAAVAQVQNSVVSGTSVDQAIGSTMPQSFTWTYAGKEFRNEDDTTNGSHILVSNGGNPQDFHDGAWAGSLPILTRTNLPYHIPAIVLVYEINNPGYAFAFLGTTPLNGINTIHVQIRDDSDLTGHLFTPQDWYFDPATNLPLRVEYLLPVSQNPSECLPATLDFSAFKSVSGILVPFQLTFAEGSVASVATVSSAAFNSTVNSAGFAPTSGSVQ